MKREKIIILTIATLFSAIIAYQLYRVGPDFFRGFFTDIQSMRNDLK